MHVIIIIRST